jgi:hypothetical protein
MRSMRVNDDLGFRGLVKNQIGIWQRGHAPDGRIVRAGADAGIKQQKIDDRLNARLNAPRALRRIGLDVIED